MPHTGLDTDTVVAAAAALADADGLEAVTLARLASQLGVRPLRSTSTSTGSRTCGGGWPPVVRAQSPRCFRSPRPGAQARTRSRRWRTPTAAMPASTPARTPPPQRTANLDDADASKAAAELLDTVLAVLRGYGLADDGAVHATRVVRSALHGFFGLPLDLDASFDGLVAMLDQGLKVA